MKELEASLQREVRVSTALRDVSLALGTTVDLDQLLELILSKITEALEADRATLYLLDETRGDLVSRIVQGSEVRSIRLKLGQGIAGHVAKTGRPVRVKDPYSDPRFSKEWDLLSGYRTRCILAAPMKNHLGRTIGVVQVLNKTSGEFTDDDLVVLAALSTQAAVSIDNSRLFLSVTQKNMQLLDTKEQLEHRVRDLKLLFDLEHAMGHSHSLEELFVAVLGEAMRSTEARAAAIALRDGELGRINLHVIDDRHGTLRRFPLESGQGLIGHAMANDEPVVSTQGDRDPRTDAALDKLVGFKCENALAVPLEGDGGEPLGAIALYNKRDRRAFTDEDRDLLLLIAANASTSVRLQLAREAREREERLTTIGRLLSGVIHDMKTPLTVISGYVQRMKAENERPKRDEFAGHVFKQFEHIAAMQREVLEFARGDKNLLVRKVYVTKFFDEVVATLAPELEKRNVELVTDLTFKGTARFDEAKILRVVHNLARNAAEAMAPKGGRFTIKVSRSTKDSARTSKEPKDDALVMTFSDTGPGIPKAIEHRLFKSFVTSGKKGGTGLGLAIVKKIAEEHGGTVTVSSTRRGATFKLRLPQESE
ncbi:MAG: GAF domain-containing protein [Polyangiaceae bacterium]